MKVCSLPWCWWVAAITNQAAQSSNKQLRDAKGTLPSQWLPRQQMMEKTNFHQSSYHKMNSQPAMVFVHQRRHWNYQETSFVCLSTWATFAMVAVEMVAKQFHEIEAKHPHIALTVWAPREEMADPLLLTPPCTVVTGILYLGDWREAPGDACSPGRIMPLLHPTGRKESTPPFSARFGNGLSTWLVFHEDCHPNLIPFTTCVA